MISVEDAVGLLERLRGVRTSSASTTTFFASGEQVEAWVQRGVLFSHARPGSVLVFRRDRDFFHLYHAAADVAALRAALGAVAPLAGGTAVTADLVDREGAVQALADVYAGCGFARHAVLVRMTRLAGAVPPQEAGEPGVEWATAADAPAVLAFLERLLDRYAEQIPEMEEIAAAIVRRQVLVTRSGGDLAGVLHFELQGQTATLRYWWLDDRFRGQGVGARLIRRMFTLCASARRILLWVIAGNENAIVRYEHYGFRRDGLVDQVMMRVVS